jgi:hypothetical protein
METTPFKPARSRVNLRLCVFLAIIAAPFIWGTYVGARYFINGGIQDMGDYKKVDLKALGFFNFDQRDGAMTDVPDKFRKLDGQRVMLEGFMYSPNSASRLHDFQFVYNVTKCCFNGPPLVQERVFAHCAPGKSLRYVPDYVRLVGVLHVNVVKDSAGIITSVYTMDVQKAEDVRA